jgi:hypothetical protein
METINLVALLRLPGIILGVGVGLLKLSKSIADSQRSISMYSGEMATAFAFHDIKQMFRDMASAGARANSVSKFLDAWDKLLDEWRPIEDALVNTFIELGTVVAQLTTKLVALCNAVYNFSFDLGKKSHEIKNNIEDWEIEHGVPGWWVGEDAVKRQETAKRRGFANATEERVDQQQLEALKQHRDELREQLGMPAKKDHDFQKGIDALMKFAEAGCEFYKKYSDQGVTGIEWMQSAATWNYDPQKDRAYESLRPIHEDFRKVNAGGDF